MVILSYCILPANIVANHSNTKCVNRKSKFKSFKKHVTIVKLIKHYYLLKYIEIVRYKQMYLRIYRVHFFYLIIFAKKTCGYGNRPVPTIKYSEATGRQGDGGVSSIPSIWELSTILVSTYLRYTQPFIHIYVIGQDLISERKGGECQQ